MIRRTAWHFPFSARLLRTGPSVRCDFGHPVEMTTALRVPIKIVIGDNHLEPAVQDGWFSRWPENRLGANTWKIRSKACSVDVGPTLWRRRGTAGEPLLNFMSENWCSSWIVCGRNKFGWDYHRFWSDRVGQKMGSIVLFRFRWVAELGILNTINEHDVGWTLTLKHSSYNWR